MGASLRGEENSLHQGCYRVQIGEIRIPAASRQKERPEAMKPSEIRVGKTYRNKGAGRTQRKVLNIGYDYITYCQVLKPFGRVATRNLAIHLFFKWAGGEVKEDKP